MAKKISYKYRSDKNKKSLFSNMLAVIAIILSFISLLVTANQKYRSDDVQYTMTRLLKKIELISLIKSDMTKKMLSDAEIINPISVYSRKLECFNSVAINLSQLKALADADEVKLLEKADLDNYEYILEIGNTYDDFMKNRISHIECISTILWTTKDATIQMLNALNILDRNALEAQLKLKKRISSPWWRFDLY